MSSLEDKKTMKSHQLQRTDLAGENPHGHLHRREFMKAAGLLAGFGQLLGCTKEPRELIPYLNEVEKGTQFQNQYYATFVEISGQAQPLIVKSLQGRPLKVEGNPRFESSAGSTSLFAQAELYNLYNPKRLQFPLNKGKKAVLSEVNEQLIQYAKGWQKNGGNQTVITLPPLSSPGTLKRLAKLKEKFPKLDFVTLNPLARSVQVEKKLIRPRYNLKNAETLITLDDDMFLATSDAHYNARQFMQRRKGAITKHDDSRMNRLFCYEPQLSQTGVKADKRVALSPSQIKKVILKIGELAGLKETPIETDETIQVEANKIYQILKNSAPNALLTLGEHYPDQWKKRVWAINQKLGAEKATFSLEEVNYFPDQISLKTFKKNLLNEKYKTLIDLGGNPLYFFSQKNFQEAFQNIEKTLAFALFPQETTKISQVVCPLKHDFETWKLGRESLGQVTFSQPLTQAFFPSFSHDEVLATLLEGKPQKDRDLFQKDIQTLYQINDSKKVLQTGKQKDERPKTFTDQINVSWETEAFENKLELVSYPDPSVLFGEYSHNPWAQEIPKPVSKITWMNAFFLSPELAKGHNLKTGDFIEVQTDDGSAQGPVSLMKGMAQNTITTTWGYGRQIQDPDMDGKGVNAREALGDKSLSGAKITKLQKTPYQFATTQKEFELEEQTVLERLSYEELKERTPSPQKSEPYTSEEFQSSPQWGMTIDLTTCIGCNACTLSCQQENNIPFVGEKEVAKGREMHWIRVDTYRVPVTDNETLHFQPVTCVHCEEAPCETVCPVNATVHSEEGTNQMVYNRCIGTRYCSNNCPYKVRSFNFYAYKNNFEKPLEFILNPDVTVRARGVMEKCTYCVQRLNAYQRNEPDATPDGKLQTACQSACPTQAIQFGDLTEASNPVQVEHQSERYYDLLAELGTKPRTGYLADVKKTEKMLHKSKGERH